MAALGLALVIAAAGLGTLVWLWRADRSGGLFILAAMPFALLFPAAGTAAAAWQLIQGSRRIAQAGSGGLRSVTAFSADSTRVLLLGVLACAMVVIIAAILQWLATDPEDSSAPPIPGSQERGASWLWVLTGWPLLALATAGPVVRVRNLPVFFVKLAQGMGYGGTPAQAEAVADVAARLGTEATPGALSAVLSSELVQLSFSSFALGGVLFVVGVIGIVAFTSTSKPRWMVAWSWIALFVVLAGAAGLAMTLAGDLRAIELAGR